MKNIYMVQPNSQYGNSVYFPYAVGSLIAYAFKNEEIKKEYDFISFFYKKENIEECIKQIDSPFVVGFSCYVWNYEYNKAFARAIKEKWPECRIIFGGHQVNEKSGILEEDYIDYIILGEGEQSFESLLLALAGKCDIKSIPNLMYREDGVFTSTEKMLTQIPHRVSPYVEGYFDEIVKNEELEFSAILETNRGCPNRCAFCDWGNIKSRVRLYNMELVKKEIDWFSENRIEYVYAADANFGLFPRDEEIIDYIIQKHSENGYPQKFQATYSKNNPEVVFRINKRLHEAGMRKGATLSLQSMNEGVLKNIGRENMPLDNYKKLMGMYNTEGIAAYSEIIIGLPGETYDTMKEGIETLLECGQHSSINFFNCELLKNSIMGSPD
ncbi:MAG: radical SAM protein, partial [Clostridia bacterium]|nr:radical SAM protein [Clostridia bacterium]